MRPIVEDEKDCDRCGGRQELEGSSAVSPIFPFPSQYQMVGGGFNTRNTASNVQTLVNADLKREVCVAAVGYPSWNFRPFVQLQF